MAPCETYVRAVPVGLAKPNKFGPLAADTAATASAEANRARDRRTTRTPRMRSSTTRRKRNVSAFLRGNIERVSAARARCKLSRKSNGVFMSGTKIFMRAAAGVPDDVSNGSARRRLAQFRSQAPSATWFRQTYARACDARVSAQTMGCGGTREADDAASSTVRLAI